MARDNGVKEIGAGSSTADTPEPTTPRKRKATAVNDEDVSSPLARSQKHLARIGLRHESGKAFNGTHMTVSLSIRSMLTATGPAAGGAPISLGL